MEIIEELLKEKKAAFHDILILFPSVNCNRFNPASVLCNRLSTLGYNICIQFDHGIDIDEEVLHDKIWVSNFHKIKGIERKHVIVFNFDSSYFKFYGKNLQSTILPNILYVALSRASSTLYMIHHENNRPLEFIDKECIKTHCKYDDTELNTVFEQDDDLFVNKDDLFFPSTFSHHVNTLLLSTCIAQLSIESYNKQHALCFASRTNKARHGSVENVSDINSQVINIYLQRSCGNTCNLKKLFKQTHEWLKKQNVCHERYNMKDYETYDFTDILAVTYLATAIVSFKSNLIFRLKQLHTYDWLSRYMIEKTLQNLEYFIEKNIQVPLYEEHVDIFNSDSDQRFCGYIDCYDVQTDVVYEFKCTNAIDDHHIIQTVLYRYMMDLMIPDVTYTTKTSYIYNMKTNECVEITASHETIKGIIDRILRFKNSNTSDCESNDDFVRSCLKEYSSFF